MLKLHLKASSAATALAAAAAIGVALPTVAHGQVVSDRALSDVRVDRLGSCTTLTVNFNIRVQLLSYFPTEGGRELHVRIRPLDNGGAGTLRESLRTPTSVPELRSIEYEGANPSGPALSLFFTRDMRFDVNAGQQPQSIVIRLDQPGSGAICSAADEAVTSGLPSTVTRPAAAAPEIPIPPGLFAINLVSQPQAIDLLDETRRAAIAGRIAYEMSFERDSEQWHRLRIGFFETREKAETERAALMATFPDAWVVQVNADERAQGVANRLDLGAPIGAGTPTSVEVTPEQAAEVDRLIAEAEQAITDGENDRAVQLLTRALELPESANSARALELLGLTRERKGQLAHAQAEYEEYLRRYPSGDAADRVKQRLAAIKAPAPGGQLREPTGGAGAPTEWSWGARGSVSQFYFRDQSSTKFVDASRPDPNAEPDDSVNLNQLLSTADLTISGGNDRRQLLFRAAGSYAIDFREGTPSRPVKDIKSITALYLDYSDSDLNTAIRIGRQTRNSSGVLGRFDGALIGWQAQPKLRFNVVGGFPVLSSRQTHILKERYFYGVSVDVGSRQSPLQTTVYWFDQRAKGGFIDRQSVGFEGRYLAKRFNAFALIDYDVKFNKLNLGIVTLNYRFPDESNLSVTADYRQSPLLTTNNALIGQIDSTSFLPVADLEGLRAFFTDAEIYQLALDRTLVAKSLTATYSRPISEKLQANIDFTVTDTGGTKDSPASSGTEAVPGLPATGSEYFYGAQLVGTGLLWENDIYILSGRYADTQRSQTWTIDFNARVPVSRSFRVSPRIRYGHRTGKFVDTTFDQLQPTVRFNLYPMRHSEFELEVGANFSKEVERIGTSTNQTSETGYVITAGYRFDF